MNEIFVSLSVKTMYILGQNTVLGSVGMCSWLEESCSSVNHVILLGRGDHMISYYSSSSLHCRYSHPWRVEVYLLLLYLLRPSGLAHSKKPLQQYRMYFGFLTLVWISTWGESFISVQDDWKHLEVYISSVLYVLSTYCYHPAQHYFKSERCRLRN